MTGKFRHEIYNGFATLQVLVLGLYAWDNFPTRSVTDNGAIPGWRAFGNNCCQVSEARRQVGTWNHHDMFSNCINTNNISNDLVFDKSKAKEELKPSIQELFQMLKVIEEEILPKTVEGVNQGNKVFGAAILDSDFNTIHTATNDETTCPLFHGEMNLIYEWSKKCPPATRGPIAKSSTFLSTHEPCCMCISGITWTGFQKVFYLFPYELTSEQGIPHDLNIMYELWGVKSYRKQNEFCSTANLMELIRNLEESVDKQELQKRLNRLVKKYYYRFLCKISD